jgi:AraC family transcriptional regulator, L-rhamnose operon transcriptional activator RhaR
VATVARLHWTELPVSPGIGADVYWDVHDGDYEPHDHDFFEIAVVLEGLGSHQILRGQRELKPGDAFAIRAGSWHAWRGCEGLLVASCCVQATLLERELLWLAEEPRLRLLLWPGAGIGNGIVHVHLSPGELAACSEALERLASPPEEEPRPYQVAQLLLILRSLAQALQPNQVATAMRLAAAPAGVLDALHLLESDLARAWTLGELAAAVALSPSHLTRRFRGTFGQPPMAYLSVLRAEAAAIRLLRGNESIATVGAAVGWGDPNYFARRFRAHFGCSPTAFRSGGLER